MKNVLDGLVQRNRRGSAHNEFLRRRPEKCVRVRIAAFHEDSRSASQIQ